MRKTIDLTENEIAQVEEFQKRNGLKSFSAAIRSIINAKKCSCSEKKGEDIPDDKFALIGDALIEIGKKMDDHGEKLELLTVHLAPKSAGEVKT